MSDVKQPLPEVSTPADPTPAVAPDADRNAPTNASGVLLTAAELHSEPAERDHNDDLPSYSDALSSADSKADRVHTPGSPVSRASTLGNEAMGNRGGEGQAARAAEPLAKATAGLQGRPTMGERFHRLSSSAGKGLNKAANIVGAEGWWPSTGEQECLKTARILHSFTRMPPLVLCGPRINNLLAC
jgi:hypothetical protein